MLEIEKKTNIVALAAFVIAITTALWNVVAFLRGPQIAFLTPHQMLIRKGDYGRGKDGREAEFLQVNAVMTYCNTAIKGYSDVVVKEGVKVFISGKGYDLTWHKFEHTFLRDEEPDELKYKESTDAIPVVVDGGDAVTHETNFRPLFVDTPNVDRRINFLPWDDFLKAIEKVDTIKFVVSCETMRGWSRYVECIVKLDEEERNQLQTRGWTAPDCVQGAGGKSL